MEVSKTRATGIVIMWGAAIVAAVWYIQTVREERAKRKAIEVWKKERLAEIKAERERAAR